ncbi:MAG TPA: YhdP family protein [Gallionella sp.]|nr:YhdP family protein [Gallionella sp.]
MRLLWYSLSWLTRLTIVASAALAVLIAMSIVVLRYWVLPDIEQHHDRITLSLSQAIGNPVTIGKITADWQGFRPHLSFTDVRILDKQRQPALMLSRIDGSVSWLTLLTAELRLASLEIDRPELLVRRDAQGMLFIGGVALSRQGTNNDLADWLLHQSRMVVRDALIVWLDEQRNAPPLVLRRVGLHIENGLFDRHRFALRALPPEELATPLDVRGDFYGESFDNPAAWRGQLFTQLDHTDVTAWRPWLDLPGEFSRGRGALRGWLGIEGGKVAQVTADLALHDVVTRLAKDVPEMVVQKLQGRAAWKYGPDELEISTRHLAMRLHNGIELQPTDFYFRTMHANGEHPAGGEVRANLLQLETLTALSNFLPLEASLRSRLEAYAPRGKVSNLDAQWQGQLAKPDSYRIKGSFERLALRQVGQMPGFSGLSMDVNGSETSGRLHINARQLVVEAPEALREPLSFTTLTGQAGWERRHDELLVTVDNVAVTNDDLAGNLYGSYRTQAGTLGVLDLTVALTRGDVRRAARYTPLVALDRKDNDWLNGALLAGSTDDFRVRVKGNLSDFPLKGTEDALLEIGGHARDVVLEFDNRWPKVEKIDGEFWIRGNKLEVKSDSATMLGARLHNLTVAMPDLMSTDMPLEIRGEADAQSETFLQFIQQSPVRGYISGFTDGMHAVGNGHLKLFTRIPLRGDKPVQVAGTVSVRDNDIDLGKGVPWLRKTRGALVFTETGMKSEGVAAEILGGPATIDVRTAEGGVVDASARGRVNLDALRSREPHPLLNYLRGGAAWDANIVVVKKTAQMQINSTLVGIQSTLPQPFAKRAVEQMVLRAEKDNVTDGQDVITLQLGKLLNVRLARREENGEMVVKRGAVNFGGQGRWPEQEGVWLVGRLPVLSLEGWGGLLAAAGDGADGLPIAGADLIVDKVSGFGMSIDDLRIAADKRGDGIVAKLASDEANGEVEWQPRGEGKITARLQNLVWVEDRNAGASPAKSSSVAPDKLPALQIAVENLEVKGKQVGRFELVGYPEGNDWRLRRMRITNPDGSLSGDGVWHGEANARTSVNLLLDISDAGKILARSGYPNTVKGGSGRLAASLSWAGTPDAFNYATLNGTFNLDTGKGQFLKMDPGIGKLLGILSLQSLPKRITLDFNDVFSEGFQFDSIKGNAQVSNGVLETQDMHLNGSAAKVTMKGRVDLNRETQDLRVRILPTVGDSVSLLGAFAAGPAVGVGALLVNKVLGEPLDKLVSFEYNVSGTWSDPKVVKVGEVPVKSKESNPK